MANRNGQANEGTAAIGELTVSRQTEAELERWVSDNPEEFTEDEARRVRKVLKHLRMKLGIKGGPAAWAFPISAAAISLVLLVASSVLAYQVLHLDPAESQIPAIGTTLLIAQAVAAASTMVHAADYFLSNTFFWVLNNLAAAAQLITLIILWLATPGTAVFWIAGACLATWICALSARKIAL